MVRRKWAFWAFHVSLPRETIDLEPMAPAPSALETALAKELEDAERPPAGPVQMTLFSNERAVEKDEPPKRKRRRDPEVATNPAPRPPFKKTAGSESSRGEHPLPRRG